ncbi:MAG: transporter permease [Actinomycetia bacterium]|nr:transporter permease [Actinomycetes bacterium]
MTVPDQVTQSEEIMPMLMGPKVGKTRAGNIAINVGLYIVAFAAAFLLVSILILATTTTSPWDVMHALYTGSVSGWAAIGLTLEQATPILIVAIGVVIANRAGTFTIGPQGQFLMGGLVAGFVMFKFGLPVPVALPLCLVGGAIGGAIWAGIAALLRYTRGVDVIISTLLLNFVALELVDFCLNKIFLLQENVPTSPKPPQSAQLTTGERLPRIGHLPGFSVTSGVLIAIALTVAVAFVLARTKWGFRVRMLGLNPTAAQAAGVSMALFGGGALILSGAFAGLAGGVWFAGIGLRLTPGFEGGLGGEGLLVALIARRSVIATVPIAIFFGMLHSGGGYLATTGVPTNIVDIIRGLVVLAAIMPPVILHVWDNRRSLRVARRSAQRAVAGADLVEVAA